MSTTHSSFAGNSDQLKELREQIREQSKWTFYLNHILEQIKDSLIEGEKKLKIEFDLEEVDDSNTFKFIYDRFKNFIAYCYDLKFKINAVLNYTVEIN